MAPKKGKNSKRRKDDNYMPRKRRKVEKEEKVDEPAVPLKITGINDNCLLDIFDHLSLVDLLNVADSNSHLKQVAEMVFKRNFASKMHIECIQPQPDRNIEIDGFRLLVKDLKSCLQILRCFGHLLVKVELDGSQIDGRFCTKIGQYLAKYCSKTLEELSLRYASSRHLFDGIDTSFGDVHTVVIDHCFIRSNFVFEKLFPNTYTLDIDANQFENPKIIEKQFGSLECVRMGNATGFNIKEFFRLNPQLRSLRLFSDYDPDLIRCINNYLPNLNALQLYDLPDEFHDDRLLIHLGNVEFFIIITRHRPTTIVKSLPFSFGKLEALCVSNMMLNQNTLDSLAKIEHLDRLQLINCKGDENFIEHLLKLENVLTNVKILDIRGKIKIPAEYVLRFLEQSKSIEKFMFAANKETGSEIESRLDTKWKAESQYSNQMTIVRSSQSDSSENFP